MGEAVVAEWLPDTFPAEAKADPVITKYKSPEEFYKGVKNMAELVGRKGVIVPQPGASADEMERFYTDLGRPEKPEGYKLSEIKDLHPAIKITPESQQLFFQAAHKAGLTSAQADHLNGWFLGTMTQAMKQQEVAVGEQRKAHETALRQKWGQGFEQNLGLAKRVVTRFGGPQALEAFGELGDNPTVLEFLASVGKRLSEDSMSALGISALETSAGDAKQKIAEILNNKAHAYWNEKDVQHKKAVAEMTELYKIAERAEGA